VDDEVVVGSLDPQTVTGGEIVQGALDEEMATSVEPELCEVDRVQGR
jgi:hypothetical protein